MSDMINKVISFILYLVNAIKGLVASLTGKEKPEEETTPDEPAEG